MTNESKRHTQELAAAGWKVQRRASLYHALLRGILDETETAIWDDKRCPFCEGEFNLIPGHWRHTEYFEHADDCVITRIERALSADADQIAAMLADLGGEARA